MKLFERMKFFNKMLILGRKNTIIMFLGLGISLAMISEGLIFMYSFQYEAFLDFNNEIPTTQFTITLDSLNIVDEEEEIISKLYNITMKAIEGAGLKNKILRTDWYSERGGLLYLSSKTEGASDLLFPNVNIYGIPTDFYSAFESILYDGTMPYRANEVLVVATRNVIENTNLSKLGLFPLYVPVFVRFPPSIWDSVELGIPEAGNYVNVTGVITTEDFENYNGVASQDLNALKDYFSDQFIITKYSSAMDFVKRVNYLNGLLSFNCRFSFDLTKIDSFNIAREISKLLHLSQEITREFNKIGLNVVVVPHLIENLRSFNKEFMIFQLIYLLFLTPLIGMALSLTNYSTNLMKDKQKKHVSNMIQRGSSRREIISFLILQVVELTIMAILICVLIGYPFASLMIRSNAFLNFGGTSYFPAINMLIFFVIIGAAFLFSIIVNAKNIWDISDISTTEALEQQYKKSPFGKKYFLTLF